MRDQDDDTQDPLAETTLDTRMVYQGQFLRVYEDSVRCPDGTLAPREYLRHPGAVCILPLLDDGQLILERQYRYPVKRSFIEIPAGKIDPGESLLACAQRELKEETGYVATEWVHLGGFHNAIGYCDEKLELFLARGLRHEGGQADEGELIDVFTAPWQTLLDWVREGKVTDVKTIIAAHWLEKYLQGKWPGKPATA